MLQHSRSSTGVKEPTDINALADEYLRLSYHACQSGRQGLRAKDKTFNATIGTDFDESLSADEGTINVVPQDMGRVLLNLFNNAFQATIQKLKTDVKEFSPKILVSTKRVQDKAGNQQVEIRVKDNGNGIPKNVVTKIFQPFFTTKPTGQGTGLGLSLSYDIIKAHNGEIEVKTTEGEGLSADEAGTEFIIHLPV